MSVTASTGKVQYTLTSATAALVIPFYFIADSHIRVVRTRSNVDQVLSSGFTLAGAGVAAGGTLTPDGTQTAIGDRITIKRSVPQTQLVSYAPNDRFPASTHERGMDQLTMLAQQTEERSARALVFGEGEIVTAGNVLPAIPTRGQKVLGFDIDGQLDLSVSLEDLRTLVIANPVEALTDVVDYGSISDAVTDVADYGSIS